jgi:hypothetical protein
VNGDGIEDIVVGCHLMSPMDRYSAGMVNILYGKSAGLIDI